jgi:uncharacterized protein YbjT (DUF2867 family)
VSDVKIVVIGGTGLIGSKLVVRLIAQGHETVAAAPSEGVNTMTGEGVAEALAGAAVVVDVSNSPSFEEAAVLDFFTTSTTNLLAAAKAANVGHYVALSVVGTERLAESPYFRGKIAQERLIRESGAAYSIVHATQFFEFVDGIAKAATVNGVVHLSPAFIQPIAADDVAEAVSQIAVGPPVNGTVEIAGPERFGLDELVRKGLSLTQDPREVVADPDARYFGAHLDQATLVPGDGASLAGTRYEDWLARVKK